MNRSSSLLEKESIQEVSTLFRLISDPTRLSILFLLHREELSVGNSARNLNMENVRYKKMYLQNVFLFTFSCVIILIIVTILIIAVN